jgi:uncharacterized protein YcbX
VSGLVLSGIYRYPLKSARGAPLQAAQMDRFGLAGDRRWMLVDESGRFQSQRHLPAMALLEVSLLDGGLRLRYQGQDIAVETPDPGGQRLIVRVWEDTVAASLAATAVNDWLSERFAQPLRLVYYPDDAMRGVEPGYAPSSQLLNFADGFPLLIVSQESLDRLNERLPAPVPMDRFRPNLVISGAQPHAEDGWRSLRIGAATISLLKPCSRCAVPSIDQHTAARDPLINRALAQYRRRAGVIYFGMNAIAGAGASFSLGDTVEVLD